MAKRKPFYLYKRKKKHGSYWYVCYINPETGVQETAKSIDVIKEKLSLGSGYTVKDRDSAAVIAAKGLESGLIFSTASSISFNSYCLQFWDYDRSEYVAMRNGIRSNSIGREYCKNMESYYRKHVMNVIPASISLSSVNVNMLDKVVSSAFASGLASGTVQLIILSFSVPLKEAVRKRLISSSPADNLLKVQRVEKERGVLTSAEIKALMAVLSAHNDDMTALAVKLALATGMRSGELRALTRDNISLSCVKDSDGRHLSALTVDKSIAPYSGIKCTKNRKARTVLIDDTLASELVCRASGDVVFPGKRSKYLTATALRSGFYSFLNEIGIDERVRTERNLSFHSLRHTFNTLLSDENINVEERLLALGHSSQKVNIRYDHVSVAKLVRVARVSSRILSLTDQVQ